MSVTLTPYLKSITDRQELARQQSLSNHPPGQSPNPGDLMKVVYLVFLAIEAIILCVKGDNSFKKLVGTDNWNNASNDLPPEFRTIVDDVGKWLEVVLLAFKNQSQNYRGQQSGEDSEFLVLEPMFRRPETLLPTIQEGQE